MKPTNPCTEARRPRVPARPTATVAAAAATIAALAAPLAADDSEIFFGRAETGEESSPNVLFVLDTASSTNRNDGFQTTRMERLKEAMTRVIDRSTNLNFGLMRLNGNDGGGAVTYPITPLDALVCESGSCGEIGLSGRIEGSADDATEHLADGEVVLDGDTLGMGPGRIAALRFTDIAIPQGAKVTNARLELTASADTGASATMVVRAEAVDHAAALDAIDSGISSRDYTVAGASWTPEDWTQGQSYASADLAPVIEEVIARPGWCGGNALALRIDASVVRDAYSHDADPARAARLVVSYDATSIPADGGCIATNLVRSVAASGDDANERASDGRMYTGADVFHLPASSSKEMYAGLRFTNIDIPRGAHIESASIVFEADRWTDGEEARVSIHGEASDDAAGFGTDRRDLSGRSRTSTSVPWSIPALSADQTAETPDLSAIVQQLVDRPGWQAANALGFVIAPAGGSGRRALKSRDGEVTGAPLLRIGYRAEATTASLAGLRARDRLKAVIRDMVGHGGKPIMDAYHEATQYYFGEEVDHGRTRGKTGNRFFRVSHPDSYTGGTVTRDADCTDADLNGRDCADERITGSPRYLSPIDGSCRTQHLVFVSDGQPTASHSTDDIRALIGRDSCEVDSGGEACGIELASWLHGNERRAGEGRLRNITTYAIGFNYSSEFFEAVADAGGGTYHEASSADELTAALETIIEQVLSVNTSFVAPAATVSQYNRLTHDDDIYFAVFSPAARPLWDGNLKRYRLGAPNADGALRILDANGDDAVDSSTGFFGTRSRSFWSSETDGSEVALGGAAERIGGAGDTRRLFTYTAGSPPGSSGVDLTDPSHALAPDNAALGAGLLGVEGEPDPAAYRAELLRWARGHDTTDEDGDGDVDEARAYMGDPMHSKPILVSHSDSLDRASRTVFVSTNEGFLHAIDTESGDERYAFMPQALLPNLRVLHENGHASPHPYGLDGALSFWSDDADDDALVDADEDAWLYVGMRRGGSAYHALDVSARDAPRLAWTIDDTVEGFGELGQSWSRAVPARVMLEGVAREVVIFAAGYDTDQDPPAGGGTLPYAPDDEGRGVFIVDARTGERLWAGLGAVGGADRYFSEMRYSIPGDVRVIDVNQDTLADQLWVADTGGQLWRFDITPYHQGDAWDLVDGGVVARLGGSEDSEARRFYHEPDVALIENDGRRFFTISIGSGWRAHPLDTGIRDRFYVLRTDAVDRAPAGYGKLEGGVYVPITEADLVDVSARLAPDIGPHGWYLDLAEAGEKVLAPSITVNDQVIFTSYRPGITVDACSPAIGSGAVYALDVLDGSPAIDAEGDGDELGDRTRTLAHAGIPPAPAALITEEGATILVGTEQPLEALSFGGLRRTYWLDAGADN